MSLGEYLGAGSSITKGLFHLNGNANDSSGNGNNGTTTNVSWVGGVIGSGSASFNGTSSYIRVVSSALSSLLNGRGGFTINFIIKIHSINPSYDNIIIDARDNDYNGIRIEITNLGRLRFVRSDGFTSNIACISDSVLSTGILYYISLYYDGTNAFFVINGIKNTTGSSTLTLNSLNNINIGSGYASGTLGNYFNGVIDEVIIENRAWTAQEIQKYYTYSKGRFGIL